MILTALVLDDGMTDSSSPSNADEVASLSPSVCDSDDCTVVRRSSEVSLDSLGPVIDSSRGPSGLSVFSSAPVSGAA